MGRVPDGRQRAGISCPAVVISGREDVITICEVNREIAARILGAEFILFDRCGHIVPLEQPDALTRRLRDWVASQQDAASERHAP